MDTIIADTPALITEVIETPRLLLKILTPEKMDELFSGFDERYISAFLALRTAAELKTWQEKIETGLTNYNIAFRMFTVCLKESGECMGLAGYHSWQFRHFRAEIGYALHEEFRNKGFMTEAMKSILIHGFEDMGLHRVEAMIGPDNVPSLRLAGHFGFTHEGTLREHYLKDGILRDSGCFSLLKQEYEAVRQSW